MIGLELILNLKKMSFKDLADRLGITKQNISMWISTERKIPKKYLQQLEEILNIPKEYYQKEIVEIDKLQIEKLVLEKCDLEDDDIYYKLREIELNINMYKIFNKFKNLFQDKNNGELEDIVDTLEVFFKIYENEKSQLIGFSSMLYSINNYLEPAKVSSEEFRESKLEYDKKYNVKIETWIGKLNELLYERQEIENEYEKANKKFWNL